MKTKICTRVFAIILSVLFVMSTFQLTFAEEASEVPAQATAAEEAAPEPAPEAVAVPETPAPAAEEPAALIPQAPTLDAVEVTPAPAQPEEPKGSAAKEQEKKTSAEEPAKEATKEATKEKETSKIATPAKEETAVSPATPQADEQAAEEPVKKDDEKKESEDEDKEETREVSYPAVTLTRVVSGVTIRLTALEGSLPEGVRMNVSRVTNPAIFDAVEEKLEAQGRDMTDIIAFDITPVDKDGREVQPKKPVTVTFAGTNLDMEEGGSVEVFRVADDASSVVGVAGGGSANQQVFSANHFSIYVASTTDTDASGSGTTTNRYKIHFGESVTLETSHSNSKASYWSVSNTTQYVTQVEKLDKTFTLKNNNTTTSNIDFQATWTRYGSTETFYLTFLPQPQTHEVTFMFKDAGADTFVQDGDKVVVDDGGSATAPSHEAEKTVGGKTYVFDGWYTTRSCTTKAVLSNIKADMTVYARYILKDYTVTYMLQDAGATSFAKDSDETVASGGTATPPTKDAEKQGTDGNTYVFDGWYTEAACQNKADFTNIQADTSFYAKYTLKNYTVNYMIQDVGETTFAKDSDETVASGGSAQNVPMKQEEKEGTDGKTYVFDAWYTDEACGTKATQDDFTNIQADTDFYARYTLKKHTVTFNLTDAGKTDPEIVDTQEVEDGGDATAPTMPGEKIVSGGITYVFSGWCSDDTYANPAELTNIKASMGVYGRYTKKNYTVTFMFYNEDEEEFVKEKEITVASGDAVDPAVMPEHQDSSAAVFTGWCTSDGCTTKADLTSVKRNMTVWGRMVKNAKLTYDPNSGGNTASVPDEVVAPAGTEVHLGTATYAGHSFVGWNTDPNAQTAEYQAGQDVPLPETGLKLYAIWKEGHVTVTYYRNYNNTDTTIFESDPNAPNGTIYNLTDDMPTRPNYLFLGWATTRSGEGETLLYPEQTITLGDTGKTFYAIWGRFDDEVQLAPEVLEGFRETITYDGQPHTLKTAENKTAKDKNAAWKSPVTNDDNPISVAPPYTHKYAGYVRVGNTNVGQNHHHIYAKVHNTNPLGDWEVTGTDVGNYEGQIYAELFTHNDSTKVFDVLDEYMRISPYELIIEPAELTIKTESAEGAWAQGQSLTAGGTIQVGTGTPQAIPNGGGLVELVNGEKVYIKVTGSQTNLGTSTNTYLIDWNHDGVTAKQRNYKITEDLGTLSVYVMAEYNAGTGDTVTNMPADEKVTAATYTISDKTPERQYYTFDGWEVDGGDVKQPGDSVTGITKDVALVAQWTRNQSLVTFDPANGKDSWSEDVYEGTTVTKPADPTFDKHEFDAWYDSNGNKFDFDNTLIEADTVLTAKWWVTVTFDPDNGDTPAVQKIYDGTTAASVDDPTWDRYDFVGWFYEDGAPYYFSDPIDENTTIKAKWTPNCGGDHTWDDGAQVMAPTCTEHGETRYTCTHCGETKMEDVPEALGHDWGEWKTTREATDAEEGEQTRVCKRCGATETRPLPYDYEYRLVAGEGTKWESGNGEEAFFRFKRTEDDKFAYDRFVKIQIDGKDVPEKEASGRLNYKKERGSLIIKLQPAFLETLAEGKHVLTAYFTDGSADAHFTITRAKSNPDSKKTDSPKTGDNNLPGLWLAFLLGAAALLGVLFYRRRRA